MAAPPSITTLNLSATWVLVRAPHFLPVTNIVLTPITYIEQATERLA